MELSSGQFFQLIDKIVYSRLAQKGKAPVILNTLQINERLLLLADVELTAIKTLYKILIGSVADLGSKLPVVGQEVPVLPEEPTAKLAWRLKISSIGRPAKSVFTAIVDHVPQTSAKVILS